MYFNYVAIAILLLIVIGNSMLNVGLMLEILFWEFDGDI